MRKGFKEKMGLYRDQLTNLDEEKFDQVWEEFEKWQADLIRDIKVDTILNMDPIFEEGGLLGFLDYCIELGHINHVEGPKDEEKCEIFSHENRNWIRNTLRDYGIGCCFYYNNRGKTRHTLKFYALKNARYGKKYHYAAEFRGKPSNIKLMKTVVERIKNYLSEQKVEASIRILKSTAYNNEVISLKITAKKGEQNG